MFGWFGKKATEKDLFLASLRAAALAWGKQLDEKKPVSEEDVKNLVQFAFNEIGVKPTRNQLVTGNLIVDALLAEGDYIKEVTQKIVSGKFTATETDHKRTMDICKSMLAEFQRST